MPKKPRFTMTKIPRNFARIYFGVKVNRSKKERDDAWRNRGELFHPVELVKKTNLNIRRIFDVRKYE
jgi:hypothetical protein